MEPLPDPLYDVSDNAGKSKAILEQLAEALKRRYLTRTGKLLDTEAKLTKLGKVAGPVTSAIGGGAAGYEQWEKDSDLGTAERATPATVSPCRCRPCGGG